MNLQKEDLVISAYQMDSPKSADALVAKQEILLSYVDAAMPRQTDMSEQVHDSYDQPIETTNNNSKELREISRGLSNISLLHQMERNFSLSADGTDTQYSFRRLLQAKQNFLQRINGREITGISSGRNSITIFVRQKHLCGCIRHGE